MSKRKFKPIKMRIPLPLKTEMVIPAKKVRSSRDDSSIDYLDEYMECSESEELDDDHE